MTRLFLDTPIAARVAVLCLLPLLALGIVGARSLWIEREVATDAVAVAVARARAYAGAIDRSAVEPLQTARAFD